MRRYDDDYDDFDTDVRVGRYRRDPRDYPHSGLGIASLFIAIAMGLLLFIVFATVVIVEIQRNGQIAENDPIVIAVGLAFLGGCGMSLVGLVLGIVGAMQPDRKGLFGILGGIFNAFVLVGAAFLICLGILTGA